MCTYQKYEIHLLHGEVLYTNGSDAYEAYKAISIRNHLQVIPALVFFNREEIEVDQVRFRKQSA